jgi:hypothetical protein
VGEDDAGRAHEVHPSRIVTEPLRDIGPRNPPIGLGEDPLLIWFRYGLGNLLYTIGRDFGEATLDSIPERADGIRYAILDAYHEAKQRLAEPKYQPVGIRIDTSDLSPKEPREGG